MNPGHAALLAVAGFVAGTLNAVAGGGSLISFPALLATNIGSVSANVTNTVALWPGYVGGAIGYRSELRRDRALAIDMCTTSVIGAVIGSVLLLTTPADVFTHLVPYLVLAGTLLFAFQPILAKRVAERAGRNGHEHGKLPLRIGILLAAVYGAYFGAGLGIMLLGVLGVLLAVDLQRQNALKNALSLTINTVALVAFAIFAPVKWGPVAIMAATSLLGGYGGARFARRLPAKILRAIVIVFGLVVGIKLFF